MKGSLRGSKRRSGFWGCRDFSIQGFEVEGLKASFNVGHGFSKGLAGASSVSLSKVGCPVRISSLGCRLGLGGPVEEKLDAGKGQGLHGLRVLGFRVQGFRV